VLAAWSPPPPEEGLPPNAIGLVQKAVREAPEGERRRNSQAKGWVGRVIGNPLHIDADREQRRIEGLLTKWIDDRYLREYEANASNGHATTFVAAI
jgi:hypothetical protein